MDQQNRRLTIVQLAGDFREAAERLASGGEETYRAQRYSVEYVEGLAARLRAVTTITARTDAAYDVTLPSGARAIGAGFLNRVNGRELVRLVAETEPDLLILRSPMLRLMLWAVRHRCRTLMLLADSFNDRSVKRRLAGLLLSMLLRSSLFDVVGNHGRLAARDLARLGVDPHKIVAWDYQSEATPHQRPTKLAPAAAHILYVGVLSAPKGVDDLIEAVRRLRDRGVNVTLDLIGRGDAERMRELIERAHLADRIRQVGLVANNEVVARMAAADIVVVPSRHEYPEGMPLTISEAYCSRTPLILSDHPMFVGNVVDGESGLTFPAGNADVLADRIAQVLTDRDLYERLSRGGIEGWERMQVPVLWHELIDRWIDDGPNEREWLRLHSLAGPSAD